MDTNPLRGAEGMRPVEPSEMKGAAAAAAATPNQLSTLPSTKEAMSKKSEGTSQVSQADGDKKTSKAMKILRGIGSALKATTAVALILGATLGFIAATGAAALAVTGASVSVGASLLLGAEIWGAITVPIAIALWIQQLND